uniref:Uncharacterized protein n=1 Tax=Tanacetum cinerariifolium TaxID=118510 RepID=A0A699SN78_TANCI|nr:hypothetical protein [Tanacetum cinerariifolium]
MAGTRTAEYAGKAAGVLKDAALDVGWNTTKFAGDTAVGMAETGAAGLIGDTVVATKDVLSSVGTKAREMIASAEEHAARNLAEKEGE